ncbi:GtrA family protein [Halobacillus salinarum]|uniref:GtrA family protein n=1 Tax=Halobacillus salinarum TaxID=2932257 RepID=A0ABY4EUK4_9BACI|nr:GtrA family protein [Halobacillus salinarum]UOQ45821.1 GtrA family protein [Halobacillus salinarum]
MPKYSAKNSGTQFMKFSLTGILNTVIDVSLFFLLTAVHFPYWLAQGLSYSGGVLNSYLVNRKWTFQKKDGLKKEELLRFILVNVITLLISSIVLKMTLDYLNLHLVAAKGTATLSGLGLNFGLSRTWVFSDKKIKGAIQNDH